MKKTLIAIALVTTVVSGAAQAWTANGIGGTMEFTGSLTPQEVKNPWEVKMGENVANLDGSVKPDARQVDIILNKSIPVLAIRTIEKKAFTDALGISPVINFNGAINTDDFSESKVPFVVDVVNADKPDEKLGTLTTTLSAGAYGTANHPAYAKAAIYALSAESSGPFYGGLPRTSAKATWLVLNVINSIFPEALDNMDMQGRLMTENVDAKGSWVFRGEPYTYSAAYVSGFASGEMLSIALDAPATANMKWKASIPVTVSYR